VMSFSPFVRVDGPASSRVGRKAPLFGLLTVCAGLSACPPVVDVPDGGGDDRMIVVGPEGGLFVRSGAGVEFPRGAVTESTTLFVTIDDMGLPDIPERKRISVGYRLSPTNLRFALPVRLFLPWQEDLLVKGVDPGTWDMRRLAGSDSSYLNPLPGSRTNMDPLKNVEATTDRTGRFWLTSPLTPNIDRLEVEPKEVTLRVGEMRAFTARVIAPTGEEIDAPVTFSVLPPRVARVDASGTVTALDPGTAVLTAKAGMKTATSKIFVVRDPPRPGPVTAVHDNPFPTGNDLYGGALAPGGLGTLFVGENGTVLARSASDQWQRLYSSPGLSLRAIGGTTATNAIAVGVLGSSGVAVEFKGTAAPRVRTFNATNISELSSLWFDGTFGMAAGAGNNLLAYRNGAWVEENNPTLRRVMAITGDGAGAFAVVNELGSIYRYDPARRVWDSLFERELAVLLKTGTIVDATTGESWAVGGGRLWHFSGGAWSASNLPASLSTVEFTTLGVFDGRVVLGGKRGTQSVIATWQTGGAPALDGGVDADAGLLLDGGAPAPTGWTERTMRAPQLPRGVFGGGPRSPIGYVVGDLGAVWQWDATTGDFTELSRGFYSDVADIAATPNDVFVTVNDCLNAACTAKAGRLLHQGPTGWDVLGAPQPFQGAEVIAVTARDGEDVHVSTRTGLFRYDFTTWAPVSVSLAGAIRDLQWCGNTLVAAGDNSTVYRGNASSLAATTVGTMGGNLTAISCPSETEVWVAGDQLLASRNGAMWTLRTSMTVNQAAWQTLYAPGGGEAWAFGDARYGVYWDTTTLTAYESFPIPMDVATASWGRSVDTLYMVGLTNPPVRFGFMMRFDGVQWRLIDAGSQRKVTAIDGTVTTANGQTRTTLWLGTVGGGILKAEQP